MVRDLKRGNRIGEKESGFIIAIPTGSKRSVSRNFTEKFLILKGSRHCPKAIPDPSEDRN